MINIVLADDHLIIRAGLRKLVEQLENVTVVKECANGHEVIDFVRHQEGVNLVISDMNMPGMGGLELAAALGQTHPEIKIIILSMYDDLNHVAIAIQSGVSAYLLKSAEPEELGFAIKMVIRNRRYFGIELMDKLIDQLNFISTHPTADLNNYSERELEVLALIAEGMTNVQISNTLFLSKRTVEGHRQNLLSKTGTNNAATLIRYAIKNKLLD